MKLLAAILLFASCAFGQGGISRVVFNTPAASGALQLNPGWTYIQDTEFSCSTGTTTCTSPTYGGSGDFLLQTVAGSVWMVMMSTGNTSSVTLSSVTGGSGTWTVPSNCHQFTSAHDNVMCAYNTTGTTGTDSISLTISANASSYWTVAFIELLPPSGYTASYDTSNAVGTTTACTTCTGVGLTLAQTDAVVEFADYPSVGVNATTLNAWSSGFITDVEWNGIGLNLPKGTLTAPTLTLNGSATFFTASAIAFSTSANAFTVPAALFTAVAYSLSPSQSPQSCAAGCTLTLTSSTGSGNLLFLTVEVEGAATYVSAVSGGGAWVLPSACHATASTPSSSTSCAYVLSSSSGVSSVTVTVASAATGLSLWEVSRSSGSFVLDALSAQSNSASTTPSGPTLSLGGTNDACIQGGIGEGGFDTVQYYPQPTDINIIGSPDFFGSSMLLLNTINGTGPTWGYPHASAQTSTTFGACFK